MVGDFTHYEPSPVAVTSPAGVEAAIPVASGNSACAVDGAGNAWCWGDNSNLEIGIDSGSVYIATPTPLGGGPWSALSLGTSHGCGIRTDGSLACWGINDRGQVGTGVVEKQPTPVTLDVGTDWVALDAGALHTCALRADHTLWCWGSNDYGQIGVGGAEPDGTPRLVEP
jgi:alpha-tubulin suppressor-like RCC1 family protein